MSDQPVANLEDDQTPAPPVTAQAQPESPPAQPPAAAAPPSAEPETLELEGKQYAPVGAIIEERKQRQAVAGRAAYLEAQVQQLAQQNQALQQQIAKAITTPATTTAQVDPDALTWAQKLSLFKPDGTPDTDTASELLGVAQKRAEAVVQRQMQPIVQQTAQERSVANFRAAMNMTDPAGRKPSETALRAIWSSMPVEYTADQRVAGILALTALGADQMYAQKQVAPPASQALISEPSGGHPRARPAMTQLEETVAGQRGISADKWKELTKGHAQGRPSVLED